MFRGHLYSLEMASTNSMWFVPNVVAGRDVYLADISPCQCLVTFSFAELKWKI
jgi:hypothetical protein